MLLWCWRHHSLMPTQYFQKQLEIPGRVTFMEGKGELPKIQVNTAWSSAEIYMDGAQVTHFQKISEPPVLFLSQLSRFQTHQPIRGGVPIIFPWFGPREGEPMHGFARTATWDLREIAQLADGAVSLRLSLPDSAEAAMFPDFTADYAITVGKDLVLELVVANKSSEQDFTFENCLHSYFQVGDVRAASVTGLKGIAYLDKTENYARKTENAEHIKISQETDRIYLDTTNAIEIHDSKLGRRIVIEKSGSRSTVVWNPWTAKAQEMPDFGNEEFLSMICVESGNVAENRLTLPAGKSASLKVTISTTPL